MKQFMDDVTLSLFLDHYATFLATDSGQITSLLTFLPPLRLFGPSLERLECSAYSDQ